MKKLKLGKSGMEITRMGLGTWAIGGGPAWGGDKELDQCIRTIASCPQLGINLIDTAPGYNFGQSEKILGQALKQMNREEVHIITKCGIVWTRQGSLFNKVGDVQLYKNLSGESIREEIDLSLKRLGTDYVDVYMTHWQSVEPFFTPVSETMEVLNQLKEEGKIRAIGAANVTPDHIKEYLKYGDLDIVQAKYSVLDRQVEEELLPVCRENGIVLQAYSPLEQGLLSGTYTKESKPQGAQCNKKWFQPGNMERVIDMLEQWKPLCEKYQCTIPSLALAWVLAQGDFITILSGACEEREIRENVKAAGLELEKEDILLMREMAEALER
ncbi:aldo/keto reductase [Clostridium sp. MCC353]|uniref:NADH-dependent methylglyoxal reductase n=1 Tax=Clostridium sp. MCC353 TaxID=2592646 RepID=UPI001C010170|nr:aldo/keto reductase [Clostridium sp. MCC353]MBT9775630.1 aldo/keto reductase [Clostridium sp. MCC353]